MFGVKLPYGAIGFGVSGEKIEKFSAYCGLALASHFHTGGRCSGEACILAEAVQNASSSDRGSLTCYRDGVSPMPLAMEADARNGRI
jgi:hypothetical protein